MLKQILTAVAIIFVIGCAHHPKPIRFDEYGYAIMVEKKNVEVQALHWFPIQQRKDLTLDTWVLLLNNKDSNRDWCANVEWRVLDYNINVPNIWFYLPPDSIVEMGQATERKWVYDDMVISFPSSGFAIYRLNLMKPKNGQCVVKNK